MTQEEKRVWLIERLLSEEPQYRDIAIPAESDAQRNLLRSLMNVRPPRPVDDGFLRVQDEYLSEEVRMAGTVDALSLPPAGADGRICLWQGDITTLRVDAIVNAANSGLCGCFRPLHNCVDNIIHTKAGLSLRQQCSRIMEAQGHEEPEGQAKITPGFNLPCRYVIHTVGPMVQGRLTDRHRRLLESCYSSSLALASANGLESIAFCCISTGVFMFPNDEAARIAVGTVRRHLAGKTSVRRVVFDVLKDEDRILYEALLSAHGAPSSEA